MTEWKIKGRRPKYPDEAWVKKQIKNQLEQLEKETERLFFFMPNGGYFGVNGIPDFVCSLDGLFIGIEAKDTDGKWSQLQQDKKKEIIESGGCYILVDEDGLFKLWDVLWIEVAKGRFYDLRGIDCDS